MPVLIFCPGCSSHSWFHLCMFHESCKEMCGQSLGFPSGALSFTGSIGGVMACRDMTNCLHHDCDLPNDDQGAWESSDAGISSNVSGRQILSCKLGWSIF